MNKKILFIPIISGLLVFFLPLSLLAQTVVRCGTDEYWKKLKQNDPSFSQQEQEIKNKIRQFSAIPSNSSFQQIVTIPVVVHIVYKTSDQNLGDDVVASQITVLNQDYTRTNTDTVQTPLIWRHTAGNAQIQFCLAQRTPSGQPTNGIERRQSDTIFYDPTDVKKFSRGGLDAWDTHQYLNIWVFDIPNGILGLTDPLAFAGTGTDGVSVKYSAFGTIGTVLLPAYNKGRTTTHEIGHWLGLSHPWGAGAGNCTADSADDDLINDTPPQSQAVFGCPAYPYYDNCSGSYPGVMFMNYMGYADDACMNLFTYDQVLHMNTVLNSIRSSITTSPGCLAVGIDEAGLKQFISIYPNPASEIIYVQPQFPKEEDVKIYLTNVLGETVYEKEFRDVRSEIISIPLSTFLPAIYQLTLQTKDGVASQKISVFR